MAQWISSDTFAGRTVASNGNNWGTASDGETWSTLSGSGGGNLMAVASGEGTYLETGAPIYIARLGSNSGTDMEVSCRISPGASSDTIAIYARLSDSTHYYRLDLTSTTIQIGTKNGGSFTSLKTAAAGLTLTVGTFYWFRLRVIGTSIYGKVWQDGSSEPTTWGVTTTDSTITSGGIAVGGNPKSTTIAVQYDTFNAFTIDASLSDSISFSDSFSPTEQFNPVDGNSLTEASTATSNTTTTDSNSLTDAPTLTDQYNGSDFLNGYSSSVLNDGPARYYRLNESSGTVAHDLSPNALNGTIAGSGVTYSQAGALYGSGDADTCLLFDGSNGKVTLPQTGLPTGAAPWTLEAWSKVTVQPPSYGCMVNFGHRNNQQWAGLLWHIDGAAMQATLSTYSGDISGGLLNLNQWYYVVGTYDGTSTRLYVNGVKVSGPSNFTMNITLTQADIGIDSGTDKLTGNVDEVAIYDYALSQTQITAHYNAGISISDDTLSDTISPSLTDANTLDDSLTNLKDAITFPADANSLTDTSANNPTPTFTDSMNVSESATYAEKASLIDAYSLLDTELITLLESFMDSIAFSDASANVANPILADSVSLIESATFAEIILLTDQETLTDAINIIDYEVPAIAVFVSSRDGSVLVPSRNGVVHARSRDGEIYVTSR